MPRITLRLRPNQIQILEELKEALGCNISLILRAIVLNFLTKNEETIERIIANYNETGKTLLEEQDIAEIFKQEEENGDN